MAGGPARREPFLPLVERLNPDVYLPFVPSNELGVVFVFALAAKKPGFDVDSVQAPYPDCRARFGRRRVRIEFEFSSRSFATHAHDARECDVIVCWRHNWAGVPVGLQVIELRKLFGQNPDVFVQAYADEFWKNLPEDREPTRLWSVPSRAGPGDLLLIYRPGTGSEEGAITDVFEVMTPVQRVKNPSWRSEPDWMASIRRVASLDEWIPFSRMRTLGIHGGIESRPRRTGEWPRVYKEILRAGPSHSISKWAVP